LICVRINELDRAIVEREELGFVKVLTPKGTDQILGVTPPANLSTTPLGEYVLFGTGLIATVVVTVWVMRIAQRELSKSEANQQ
jgi:hypothetical protein